MSVYIVGDAGVDDAANDVVGDGDEADGSIRIIGVQTASCTASSAAAAATTMHTLAA